MTKIYMKLYIVTEFFSGYPSGMKLYGVFTDIGMRKLKRKEIYKRLRKHQDMIKSIDKDSLIDTDDYWMFKKEVDQYIEVTEVEVDRHYNDKDIRM